METELFLKSIEDDDIVWQFTDAANDLFTRQYPEDAISKAGSTFYTVTRRQSDKELIRVEKQLLRPQNIRASKLIEAETTPDGDILIYMALFEPVAPRKPHLSFFAYDLERKTNVDMRLDITLTKQEYDIILTNNVCSFETTRPFDTTSTAYVIVNVLGVLQGYSLTTGTQILAVSREPFVGLNLLEYPNLPKSMIRLSSSANILVASPPKKDRIQILSYSPDQTVINIISLTDQNPPEDRRRMWLAHKTLALMQPEHVLEYDPEQRIRSFTWLLDGEDYISAPAACKAIALDIIDLAVDKAYYEKSSDLEPEPQFDQSGQQVVDESGNPVLVAPKRGYPDDYETQKRARMTQNRQIAISTANVFNFYGDLKLYSSLEEIENANRKLQKRANKKNKPKDAIGQMKAVDAFDDAIGGNSNQNAANQDPSTTNQQAADNVATDVPAPPPPPPE